MNIQMLFIEWKVEHIPILFHDAFHFKHRPLFRTYTVLQQLRLTQSFLALVISSCLTKSNSFVFVEEPEPEAGGVFFVVKINIMNAHHIGTHLHGVWRCPCNLRKSNQHQKNQGVLHNTIKVNNYSSLHKYFRA